MSEIVQHRTLYTKDSKGKYRTWRMETQEGQHRSVTGIEGGKQIISGWAIVEEKNVGRSNATSLTEQALAEVASLYKKKLEKKYYENKEDAAGFKFAVPMLALKWKDYKDKANAFPLWTQPKLDGMRSTTYGEELTSRNNKPIVSAPHILEDLVPFFENHAVRLDGELYNHDLKHDFDRVMSLCKKKNPTTIELIESKDAVQYHVYDLPDHPGTFSERYAALVELSKDFPACVKLVDTRLVHDIDELDKVYADWIEDGYEGQMIRLDEVYLPGDKRDWRLMKRKEFIDAEFEVDDIQQGRGNWAGIAKRAVLKLPDGRKFEAGIKGNMIAGKKLLEEHAAGITPKECTLRFQNYTPDGIPRFGVVYHWWMNGRANDE